MLLQDTNVCFLGGGADYLPNASLVDTSKAYTH